MRNTGSQVLRPAQRYAKQISSSYKFGTGELNGASRNGEIKECTGDEWRCEWERVVKGRWRREKRRERTQTERTKLPAMVIEVEQRVKQRHCRSWFLAGWIFRLLTPTGFNSIWRVIKLFRGGKMLPILFLLFFLRKHFSSIVSLDKIKTHSQFFL